MPREPERIAKALARAGVASRREVERLIAAGRVAVNGVVLESPAVKVGARDILTVDGKAVEAAEPARLFRYHKPPGLVTTHRDPAGRPTVFEALPPGLPRLVSVGRLDLSSEGLLLLTNDGELSRALELPASGVVRRYRARAHGRVDQARLDALKDGITVDGVRYGPIEARLDKAREAGGGANLWITLTLSEGKNREVRRVLEALGLTVNRLIRLAYGPFALGDLARGAIEEVGPRVLREQLADMLAPASLPTGDRPAWRPQASSEASTDPAARGGQATSRRAPARSTDITRSERPKGGKSWRSKPPQGGGGGRAGKPGRKPPFAMSSNGGPNRSPPRERTPPPKPTRPSGRGPRRK